MQPVVHVQSLVMMYWVFWLVLSFVVSISLGCGILGYWIDRRLKEREWQAKQSK